MEAALSLGMTPSQALRFIILPQAARVVLPPMANYSVGLLKETALCSIIAVPELMLRAKDVSSSSFLPMHAFVLAAVFYYIMSFPMMRLVEHLESHAGCRYRDQDGFLVVRVALGHQPNLIFLLTHVLQVVL